MTTCAGAAAIVLCLYALGCSSGGSHRASGARATATATNTAADSHYTVGPSGYIVGDEDTDDLYHGHKDSDDSVRGYGRAAGAGQVRAVQALARRYYALASSRDGAGGCKLLTRSIAARRDFSDIVPQEYAQVAHSALFRGRSCTQVETFLFELGHRTLVAAAAGTPVVASLRVRGGRGFALLSFKTLPERQLPVRYEAGRWRVDALLDSEIL